MSRIKTKNALKKQLTENTGSHICDSGIAYGYNYNLVKLDFNEGLRVDKYGVTIPIQRYLYECLDRDEECEKLEKLLLRELKIQGVEYVELCFQNEEEIISIFNNLDIRPISGHKDFQFINTYNYDNDLSQVLQFMEFEYNGTRYVILETHNGCDVRGGYSSGKVYEVTEEFFGNASVMAEIELDNDDYDEVSLWSECEFNDELKKYIHKESGKEVNLYCFGCNFMIYA